MLFTPSGLGVIFGLFDSVMCDPVISTQPVVPLPPETQATVGLSGSRLCSHEIDHLPGERGCTTEGEMPGTKKLGGQLRNAKYLKTKQTTKKKQLYLLCYEER